MKAKLIKNSAGEYHLIVDKCPDFVSISEPITNGFVIASVHNNDIDFLKLSLKNCQAIERGYDLDELAKRHHKLAYIQAYNPDIAPYVEADYKAGFQKALEILGDKKFSEEDIRKAMDMITHVENWDGERGFGQKYTEDEIIQSLQQNEWDVEIEMICPHPSDTYRCGIQYGCDEDGCNHPNQVPHLDADGCLILKRVV